MLSLQQVSLQRGIKPLLDHADLMLHRGERAAVVGTNGCGKSSLFQLILGKLHADTGTVSIVQNQKIAYMQQEVAHSTRPAREYILDGFSELRQLQAAIEQAEAAEDFNQLGNLHAQMDAIAGYNQSHIAETIMLGLGFSVSDYEKPVDAFSGGWRIRLNLARTLLCPSDILLLDEPTNHLDLEAIHWLEQWLKQYHGSILFISHDRDFIDACATKIFHIHDLSIDSYAGSYSDFELQRAEKLALQQSIYKKQQQRKKELESFIDRFRAKATKAKQAQSRIKALERMQLVGAVREASPYHFAIPEASKTANPLVRWYDANLGYGQKVVLNQVNLSIAPGLRLGLLGVNGAGKSTLIKSLAGQIPTLSGELSAADCLKVGYFAQHQLEALDNHASPILHVQRLSPEVREQDIRDFLGGFRIQGDMATGTIAHFSGGEKARLALALLAWQKPNVLLLDEPTNHLDLEMREALAEALQNYQGAVILVSHDAYLLRHCVDEFLLIANGRVSDFSGDLQDYYQSLQNNKADNEQAGEKSAENRKLQRQIAAQKREQSSDLRKQLRSLEKRLEELEKQRKSIESELADSAIYQAENKNKLNQLLQKQAQVMPELEQVEEQWLELQSQLEA